MLKTLIFSLVVALILNQCWIILTFFLQKTERPSLLPGHCAPVNGTEWGSEDIFTLKNGIAIISSCHVLDHSRRGRVLVFDFNHPEEGATECQYSGDFDYTTFRPLGLDVWQDKESGVVSVLIISHHPESTRVEKFRFLVDSRTLHHVETFRDKEFKGMNSLAVVGERQFYFTNSLAEPSSSYQPFVNLRYILRLVGPGNVGFYDGRQGAVLITDVVHPNGIAVSRDRKLLYVSGWGEKKLHIYRRNTDSSVMKTAVLAVDSQPDNLKVDASGDLWLTGQLSMLRIQLQLVDKHTPCPSQVVRLRMRDDGGYDVTEVLADDGQFLSGASVANKYRDKLLIGTVFHGAFLCYLPNSLSQ